MRAQSLHLLEILSPRQRPQCPNVPVPLCRGSARPPLCLPRSHRLSSGTKGFAKEGCSGPSGLPPPRSAARSRDKGNIPALGCRRSLSPRSGWGRAGSDLLLSELWSSSPSYARWGHTPSAASFRLWEQVGAVGWRQAHWWNADDGIPAPHYHTSKPASSPRSPRRPQQGHAPKVMPRLPLFTHTVLKSLPGIVRDLSTPVTYKVRSPFY